MVFRVYKSAIWVYNSFQVSGSKTTPSATLISSFSNYEPGSGNSIEIQVAPVQPPREDPAIKFLIILRVILTANLASLKRAFLCKQSAQTRNLENFNER